jgi:PAS domain S-box-containing protein
MPPLDPDDLPDGLVRVSEDGTVVSANSAARRLLGGDPVGQTLQTLTGGRDPARQGFWRGLDGAVVHLEVTASADGHTLLLRDLDDRASTMADLRDERKLLGAVLETLPQCVWVLDNEGRVLRANAATTRATGFTEAELKAEPDLLRRCIEPEDRDWLEGAVARIQDEGSAIVGDLRVRGPSGSRVHEVTVEPLKGMGVLVIARSITRERELMGIFRQTARREVDQVGLLATSLAQDLGNALTVLGSGVSIMEGSLDAHRRVEQGLADSRAATRDLLRLGRHLDPAPAPIAIGTLLERVVSRMAEQAPEYVRLDLSCTLGETLVMADTATLVRILQPLITTATKAAGRAGRVQIQAHIEANHVAIAVSDDGTGMSEPELADLFRPFPTERRRNHLALVRARVARLGGEISAQSGAAGTTFLVRLPTYIDPGRVAEPTLEAPLPHTILLVEDDPTVRESLAWVLSSQKSRVLTAATVQEAAALTNREPDLQLVLLDLGLPDPGGEACLEAILEESPGLAVLVMSGFASDEQVRRCLQKGAMGFLPKPFQLRDLRQAIARLHTLQ